jgi:hypothetical protein
MPQKKTKPTAPHSRINFPLPNDLRDAFTKHARSEGMTARGLIVKLMTAHMKKVA